MPRFRRSGTFSGRSPAPRRQIENFGITGTFDGIPTIVGFVKTVGSVGVAILEDPETLVRTRGFFNISVISGQAASIIGGAFGMYVVTADAFAIGITALPGPLTDSRNDWFVWQPFTLGGTSASVTSLPGNVQIPFDSRGMRKLKDGDVLAVMLELESNVAAVTIDGAYSFRQQFKR